MTRQTHLSHRAPAVVAITVVAIFAALPQALAGTTTRVSVSSTGQEGNDHSYNPSISLNGRYVAFGGVATNLVPDDTNACSDTFVHDRDTGLTTRVSVSSTGQQANLWSGGASISADGRYVAFYGGPSNLVPGDTNGTLDVFLHDRNTRQTTRVSVSSTAQEGEGTSYSSSISADGRCVAFASWASNLVPGDTNVWPDVFVHDRAGDLPGDLDADNDVDLDDLEIFVPALSGPGLPTNVFAADMDGDGDCDLADFAIFAAAFTGPR